MTQKASPEAKKNRKIMFVCASMQAGGAERVMVMLCNQLADRGYEVCILSFESPGVDPFYAIDGRIDYVPLDLMKPSPAVFAAIGSNIRRVLSIRSELQRKRPEVVVSFLCETNVLTVLASTGTGIPVFVSEHTDPELWPVKQLWFWLRSSVYRWAAGIVVLNEHQRTFFHGYGRVNVIPNPVLHCAELVSTESRERLVVGMGRLSREKGFDILIDAFAELSGRNHDWNLKIIGEGDERDRLKGQVEAKGLDERVFFPGLIKDPVVHLRNAGIFVLSSRIEGFPMSLCEAMACGTPVISTEYHEGVYDLISPCNNGLLIPKEDAKAMARALETLIVDKSLRTRLGKEASRIVDKYNVEHVVDKWEFLLFDSDANG